MDAGVRIFAYIVTLYRALRHEARLSRRYHRSRSSNGKDGR